MSELQQIVSAVEQLAGAVDQLAGKVDQLAGKVDHLEGKVNSLEHLMVDVKESLEREMHAGFQQITDRFDGQTVRLDRHGAMLQTGSRWTTRMTGWSERKSGSSAAQVLLNSLRCRTFQLLRSSSLG